MAVYDGERALTNRLITKTKEVYNELMPVLNAIVEEGLQCNVSPELTKLHYRAVQIAKKLHPDKMMPLAPTGAPTISHASPSPKGLDGEVDDPLAEDSA